MSSPKSNALKTEIDQLENAMHDADQFHTLEEQVADMKRRGINPNIGYDDLDAEKDDNWGNDNWKENGKWEPKTPAVLDEKARDNWNGDNGDADAPPIV